MQASLHSLEDAVSSFFNLMHTFCREQIPLSPVREGELPPTDLGMRQFFNWRALGCYGMVLGMEFEQFRTELSAMTKIGIALTTVHDLDRLLDMILTGARTFTKADAGSLYLRERDSLRFVVSQNDTLATREVSSGNQKAFSSSKMPISKESIAGYVADTKENLNIPDAYSISQEAPYRFNPDFDKLNDYRTQSILAVPMVDHQDEVLGVLQLINATRNGKVVPFEPEREDLVRSLASQAAVAVNNARLTADLKRIHLDTIYRLSVAAEYKDKDTAQHIRRMSHYSAALARKMGWPEAEVELLLYAAPMHDIGKIGIPDSILLKPGKLTPEERKVMEDHTVIGARILGGSDSKLLRLSEVIALSHHEKWDGNGYPEGLRGANIPQAGRIVAVADVFDALSSKRVYKGALTKDNSIQILQQDSGTHFDPECVAAFVDIGNEIQDIYEKFQ